MDDTTTESRGIRVVGARQHNLKNITVEIPRNRFTVITGLSGSGKSSLAFDTIYAEGQRKYVESLSAYARQFLEQMQKPDVDRIDGLSPTIAIEQRSMTSNPRSTVATTTEIYDYLRVLFARAGQPTCVTCQRPIVRHNTAQIVDAVLNLPEGTRFLVLAPLVHERRGEHADVFKHITKQGLVRARVDGTVHHLDELPPLDKTKKHTIDAVIDRLTVKSQIGTRLADSIDLAMSLAEDRVIIAALGAGDATTDAPYSARFACAAHPEVSIPELSPSLFSFNSPHGFCPACNGLGTVLEFDAELVVPDPGLPLAGGAIAAWRHSGKRLNEIYTPHAAGVLHGVSGSAGRAVPQRPGAAGEGAAARHQPGGREGVRASLRGRAAEPQAPLDVDGFGIGEGAAVRLPEARPRARRAAGRGCGPRPATCCSKGRTWPTSAAWILRPRIASSPP